MIVSWYTELHPISNLVYIKNNSTIFPNITREHKTSLPVDVPGAHEPWGGIKTKYRQGQRWTRWRHFRSIRLAARCRSDNKYDYMSALILLDRVTRLVTCSVRLDASYWELNSVAKINFKLNFFGIGWIYIIPIYYLWYSKYSVFQKLKILYSISLLK